MNTRGTKSRRENIAKNVTITTKPTKSTGKKKGNASELPDQSKDIRQKCTLQKKDIPDENNVSVKCGRSKRSLKTTQHLNESNISSDSNSQLVKNRLKKSQRTNDNASVESLGTRKSSRKLLSPVSSKNVIYKNAISLIKTPRRSKITCEVFDFEYDSTEEPKKNVKKKNPRRKPGRKKLTNNCFKSIHFEAIGSCKKIVGTVERPKRILPRPIKKIVKNVGKLPIVQIVPDNQTLNDIRSPEIQNLESKVRDDRIVIEQDVEEFHINNNVMDSPVRSPGVSSSGNISPIPNFDFDAIGEKSSKVSSFTATETSYNIFRPTIYSSAVKSVKDPASSPWRLDAGNEVRQNRTNVYLNPLLSSRNPTCSVPSSKRSDGQNMQSSSEGLTGSSDDSSLLKQSLISYFREVIMKKPKKHQNTKTVCDSNAVIPNNSDLITDHSSVSNSRSAESSGSNIVSLRLPLSPLKNNASTPKNKVSVTPKKCIDYFGFDDSENIENISPKKQFINSRRRKKEKRIVKRPCLKEWNHQPITQDAHKTATVVVPEPELPVEAVSPSMSVNKSDSDSPDPSNETDLDIAVKRVALFEDPVLPEAPSFQEPAKNVYAVKKHNTRKRKVVIVDSDKSDDSDADDYVKKAMYRHNKKKKHGGNKKEKQELDTWAASFNSMLQEAEGYDLCVE